MSIVISNAARKFITNDNISDVSDQVFHVYSESAITIKSNQNGKSINLPLILDGKASSQTLTIPSDEVEANIATDCETIMPVRHVTPFL